MSNKFRDIGLKNHTYCFFDDIINAENSDPIKTKINEKSYKSFFLVARLDMGQSKTWNA